MVNTLEYDFTLNTIRLYIIYDNTVALDLRIAAPESVEIDFVTSSMRNMPLGSGYLRSFWTTRSTRYLELVINE